MNTIKKSVAAYGSTHPHKIVKKTGGKKKLNVPGTPPVEIAILIGEMVYQMRSALDHLVFELVKGNPNVAAIDPQWEEHTQFPMRTRLPKNCTFPLVKERFSKDLPGIADVPFTFIESIQPYYGIGATNNALRFLAHLSNIDKHRHLHLTRPRIRQYESVRYSDGMSGRGYSILDRGAEIHPYPSTNSEKPMYVKRHYTALVAFNEPKCLGEANSLPVDQFLELLLNQIKTHVVPAFEKFIKKP